MSLEEAAPEIQLAVDLICLLERNALPAEVVLAALEIVKRDYLHKNDDDASNDEGKS